MSTPPKTALEGIRVLDLGRYQAGPRCALMFARMGAEVIKIESLDGDESRANGPTVRGQSAYWVQYNSGKKSLAINLRTDKGKAVLRDLVKVSDVFLQNFRPGTIEVMGFGYEALRELNRGIVMVNVSAYGQYGPYRDRIGFDPIGQALGGLMLLTGFPDDPPIKTFFPLIDRITSLHATIGALAALRERELSGEGQSLEVSLADTGFTVNEIPISSYLGDGAVQKREGNGSGPSNVYETADGWAYVTAGNNAIWGRMCEAMGKPEWLEAGALRDAGGPQAERGGAGGGAGGVVPGEDDQGGRGPALRVQHTQRSGQYRGAGSPGPAPARAGGHGGGAGRHRGEYPRLRERWSSSAGRRWWSALPQRWGSTPKRC